VEERRLSAASDGIHALAPEDGDTSRGLKPHNFWSSSRPWRAALPRWRRHRALHRADTGPGTALTPRRHRARHRAGTAAASRTPRSQPWW